MKALFTFAVLIFSPVRLALSLTFVLFLLFPPDKTLGQATASGSLVYYAEGTGRTTGPVAILHIFNPTPQTIRTTVGNCFIPGIKGHQGYLIPDNYSVEVPAFGAAEFTLEGYCTHIGKPAAPEGEGLAGVAFWATWHNSDPLPAPGWNSSGSPGFYPVALPKDITGAPVLTFPGTTQAFPYRIDFNRYPRSAGRLLFHALHAIQAASENLHAQGRVPAGAGSRQDFIQQALWVYTASLEGKGYDKAAFTAQLTEAVLQAHNTPTATPATTQRITEKANDIWASIELVGAEAKIIPVKSGEPAESFRETPSGAGRLAPAETLPTLIREIDSRQPSAYQRIIPVSLYLAGAGRDAFNATELQDMQKTTGAKWQAFLESRLAAVDPQASGALSALLRLNNWLDLPISDGLEEQPRTRMRMGIAEKINELARTATAEINPQSNRFVERARAMQAWTTQWWYLNLTLPGVRSDAAARLAKAFGDSGRNNALLPEQIQWSRVPLSGALWKYPPPDRIVDKPGKFPWWIPAAGLPVAGGVTWLLLREKGSDPGINPPTALPDAATLSCNGSSLVPVLANDSGDGIRVTGVTAPPTGNATVSNGVAIQVSLSGTNGFTVVYTITDNRGQTASATLTVTAFDDAPPAVNCPQAVSVPFGQQNNTALTGLATALDACSGPLSPTLTDNSAGVANCAGTIVRTWTATDPSGNSAACTQLITVFDAEPPILVCPAAVSVPCGQQNDPAITGTATATDLCAGTVSVSFTDDTSGFNGCEGAIVRTWTAADPAGNTAVCQQMITVFDQIAPAINCPPDIAVAFGQQNDLALTGEPTADDVCTGATPTTFTDDVSGVVNCNGSVLRTWQATDLCGNAATCLQTITVSNTAPPAITCPADITVPLGAHSDIAITGSATATDACTGNALTLTFTDNTDAFNGCDGTIIRTWTALGLNGQSASCTQTITVVEEEAPVFTFCPPAVTVPCGQQNNTDLTGQAKATDNCSAPTLSYTDTPPAPFGCESTLLRLWTAADGSGNTATCEQTITVADKEAPIITFCPPAITVACGQQLDTTQTGTPLAADACNGVTALEFTDDNSQFNGCEGTIIRTWTARDSCANTVSCSQTITVRDETPPLITCPPPVSVNCGQQNQTFITGEASAEDDCTANIQSTYSDNLSQFNACEGIIVRTWMAVDQCGNAVSCSQIISVTDTPCSFIANFATSPASCIGDCTGAVQTLIFPPGAYIYTWENGETGPNPTGLCPGSVSVSITDLQFFCTDIFTVDIPVAPPPVLVVVDVIPPSTLSSNDGSIILQIQTANPDPPYQVFVNDAPVGFANTTNFTLNNVPAGFYQIWIVDAGGSGCMSNIVEVELFPSPGLYNTRTGPSTLSWQPGSYPASTRLNRFFEVQYWERIAPAALPEMPATAPEAGQYRWEIPLSLTLDIPLGPRWQLRLETARLSGWRSLAGARTPLTFARQAIAIRQYGNRNKRLSFFRESSLAYNRLDAGPTRWPDGRLLAPSLELPGSWQLGLGGGFQFALKSGLAFELSAQGRLETADSRTAFGFAADLRLTAPLTLSSATPRQETISLNR